MLDLVILLGIALAITALIGLLLAGFVWAPWLIGLLLLVALIALMKVTHSDEEHAVAGVNSVAGMVASPEQGQANESTTSEPVMVYRGVKYKRSSEVNPPAEPSVSATQGKYRGQQWTR